MGRALGRGRRDTPSSAGKLAPSQLGQPSPEQQSQATRSGKLANWRGPCFRRRGAPGWCEAPRLPLPQQRGESDRPGAGTPEALELTQQRPGGNGPSPLVLCQKRHICDQRVWARPETAHSPGHSRDPRGLARTGSSFSALALDVATGPGEVGCCALTGRTAAGAASPGESCKEKSSGCPRGGGPVCQPRG